MLDFSHITVVPNLEIYPGGCSYGGKSAKLSPCQATFLTKLRDSKEVSHEKMLGVLYAGRDWPWANATQNLACVLRRKLKPLGIGIENIMGYGYRIEYALKEG